MVVTVASHTLSTDAFASTLYGSGCASSLDGAARSRSSTPAATTASFALWLGQELERQLLESDGAIDTD